MFRVIPLIEFLVVLGVDIDVHQKNPSAFVSHRSVLSVVHRCHRVATSRVHPPGRLLCTSCNATRPPGDHWGAGSVPRSLGAGDGSARAASIRLRRVIDPLRCARRYAAPLDSGHPERRDERLVAMGRLSHACLPYTTLGVCRTPPRHHIVPLSFPGGTSPVIAATLFARQEERGSPAIPTCMQLQARRPTMDIAVA